MKNANIYNGTPHDFYIHESLYMDGEYIIPDFLTINLITDVWMAIYTAIDRGLEL